LVLAGVHGVLPNTSHRCGEVHDLTGVTVRTLRRYDQTGRLRPAGQTGGGHRLYDRDNVLRLYRILALRRLRFSLAEIRFAPR
jgi:DNA-binding transcriptional MerR regulator